MNKTRRVKRICADINAFMNRSENQRLQRSHCLANAYTLVLTVKGLDWKRPNR